MHMSGATMKRWTSVIAALLVAACASYNGSGLKPGEARLEQVEALMGPPALRWQDADGSIQLAYPRGPAGFETFMVMLGPDGRLQSIANVLDERTFAGIRAGMTKVEGLRLIGPPDYRRSAYFEARDELAWEWRIRQGYGDPAHFGVLFDATADTVRSTLIVPEILGASCWP